MGEPRDIAVVGGGLIGVACALALGREGHGVTLFEEGRIGHGCSWGNGAQYNAGASFPMAHPGVVWRALRWLADSKGPVRIAPRELPTLLPWLVSFLSTSRVRRWIGAYDALHALNSDCARLYREMLGETEWVRLFRPNGALHVWRNETPGQLEELSYDLRIGKGVAVERLGAPALHELEPALSSEYRRALFFAGSGHVTSPYRLVEALMERATAFGARVVHERVTAIEPGSANVTLHTGTASHHFDAAVVAAGFASQQLARALELRLSLASERGYHITIPIRPDISRPITDAESAFVATPLAEGLRLVGIAEFDRPSLPPDERQSRKLVTCAEGMLPGARMDRASSWMGVRPSTPDSLPIVGPHPRHARILFATGHGHMGISGAPMTAMLIADLIAARAPRLPLHPFRPR